MRLDEEIGWCSYPYEQQDGPVPSLMTQTCSWSLVVLQEIQMIDIHPKKKRSSFFLPLMIGYAAIG